MKSSTMATNEREGAYVRSIVAKMDDGRKEPLARSPTKSPPRRSAPSYLGVSRTNSGYNSSLIYGADHRMGTTAQKPASIINGGGKSLSDFNNGTSSSPDPQPPAYVSLAMLGTKPKTPPSRYSDLGLSLKSPEKNCRSFLRNIHSFERIAMEGTCGSSEAVTMVGKKMQHLLHLDGDQPDATATRKLQSAPAVGATCVKMEHSNTVPKEIDSFVDVVLKVLNSVQDRSVADSLGKPEHDGHFFREVASREKECLLRLSEITSLELLRNQEIPDDSKGRLRAAAGKANLLLSERFIQFDGLCNENLNPSPGSKDVGPSDLAGFWDMVLIEVHSVYKEFHDIKDLVKNNWVQLVPVDERKYAVKKTKSSGGNKSAGNTNAPSEKSEALSRERKNKIAELRKLNSKKMKNSNEVEILEPKQNS